VPTNDGVSAEEHKIRMGMSWETRSIPDLVEAAVHRHPTVHEKPSWKIALADEVR
jgi:hypothetical protein